MNKAWEIEMNSDPTDAEREGYDAWNIKTLDECPYSLTPDHQAQWKRWLAADRVFREALKSIRELKGDP
jgi:hypothetical protein